MAGLADRPQGDKPLNIKRVVVGPLLVTLNAIDAATNLTLATGSLANLAADLGPPAVRKDAPEIASPTWRRD